MATEYNLIIFLPVHGESITAAACLSFDEILQTDEKCHMSTCYSFWKKTIYIWKKRY